MIVNAESLKAIKLENDKPKQTYGRPVQLINDLLDTIYHLKKEKTKWKDVAQRRGKSLRKLLEMAEVSLSTVTEPGEEEKIDE